LLVPVIEEVLIKKGCPDADMLKVTTSPVLNDREGLLLAIPEKV
jgi:hypothetical protein